MKTAVVIGSTGMVGSQLIDLLLNSNKYIQVISFVRRSGEKSHPKLQEYIVDFDHPEKWQNLLHGDVLFSAMGTTIAKAKNKTEQYKVDFTYQFNTAQMAIKQGINNYILVSAAGANPNSLNFYMNIKGELEQAVQSLGFEYISIIRPGQLDGKRIEKRVGEKIGLSFMYGINALGLFRKYRPIQAVDVAQAMLNAAEKTKSGFYTLNQVYELAKLE